MKDPCGSGRTTESVLYFRHNRRRCSLLSLSLSVCVCVCAGGGVLPPSLATERAAASVCAGAAAKQSRSGMVVIGYESKFQRKSISDRSDHCKSPKMPEKTLVHPLPGPCACPARFTST